MVIFFKWNMPWRPSVEGARLSASGARIALCWRWRGEP
eukprot:CCRYP_007022-RB/>CCRYP_007022-RB protein AED:0.45 eAED:0.45 QI:0/-1/0/1/-1/0/1/0/37